MKALGSVVRLAVLLSMSCAASLEQQGVQLPSPAEPHSSQQIVVRIRNGRTGLPIWLASPYVFVGQTDPKKFYESYRRTKLWGDAHVNVTGAAPREVKVWVDFIHRDCRFAATDQSHRTFDFAGNTLRNRETYDIDTILRLGIVAQNLCSAKTQRSEPGVLTIYVLPATFKELWDS